MAAPLWRSAERDECSAYCVRVKTPRPVATGLFALSALLLSGCSPEAAVPSAPPAAEGEALFASDEEALAAASEAYAGYLAVTNRILEDGGSGEETLRPLVSDEVFEEEATGFAYRRENRLRSVGGTELVGAKLQQVLPGQSSSDVTAFFCLSYESVDVVDETGASVVPDDRAPIATYEATIAFESPTEWRVEHNEFWQEGSACE
jgi:hypothetical protein